MAMDIKFNNAVAIGNIVTGIMYSTGDYQVDFFETRTIVNVDMSDLNPTVHIETNPLIKTVWDFKNGKIIRLKAYCWDYTDDDNTFKATAVSTEFFNTVTGTKIADFGSIQGGIWGGAAGCTDARFVKTYGIKVMFMTYYPNGVLAVQGETPYTGIGFDVLIPSLAKVAGVWDGVESYTEKPGGGGFFAWTYYNYDYVGNSIFTNNISHSLTYRAYVTAEDWITYSGVTPKPKPIDEPAGDDDPSGPGGGGGDYDPTSDPIDFPELPTGGALSSGSIKAFHVTQNIIEAMFNKLWDTSLFDINTFQKLTESPLDSLISLHCLPFTPDSGAAQYIKLGNYDFGNSLSAPKITSQYKTINCGTMTLPEHWGNALDRSPYCRISLFLPFIGIKDILADDVIKRTVSIKYNVDVLTGDLTAQVKCGESVLYKFQGNCKAIIPVTARSSEMLANLIKGAGTAAIGAIRGGAVGALSAGISGAINTVMSKTEVSRSGDLSGAVGMLDHFFPYFILHRPMQSLPAGFSTFKGYPSNITATLSSLSGYTEVEYIHLTGIDGATDTELNEIEALLKKGVII